MRPAPRYVQFPEEKHHNVRNVLKIYPLSDYGELHKIIFSEMRSKYPQGERTWTVRSLRNVYWDLEMQQEDMGGRFRNKILVTALFNLHKKMVCWSHPDQFHVDAVEFPVQNHFRFAVLHSSVFDVAQTRVIDRPEWNDRQRDQAFICQMDIALRESRLEGSMLRIFTMPSPRHVWEWLGPTGIGATWGPEFTPPPANLPELMLMDPITGAEMPDPPVFVWKKVLPGTDPEEW